MMRLSLLPLLSLLSLLSQAVAHITLNPNYGAASGAYFHTSLKIPHGEPGKHTTRLELKLPRGVLSARPEVPAGWSANITERNLDPEEVYISHGSQVTTAPDLITFQADSPQAALYTDHLMMIGLQLKIGCIFNDAVDDNYGGSNSIYQGQHTLWFKVTQYSSLDGTLDISSNLAWTGALKDNAEGMSPSWNPPSASGRKACPYIFIHGGSSCSVDDSGTAVVGGMEWMGVYVAPKGNMGEVMHEQHVIQLATEAALTSTEVANKYADKALLDDNAAKISTNLAIGLVALVLSILLSGVFIGLVTFRLLAKQQFATTVAAVPLMTTTKVELPSNV